MSHSDLTLIRKFMEREGFTGAEAAGIAGKNTGWNECRGLWKAKMSK